MLKKEEEEERSRRNGAKVCQKSVSKTRLFVFEEKSIADFDARTLEEVECRVGSC